MTVYALRNPVKHYAWGSRTALPELLGAPSPSEEPWAELWVGAHPRGSSEIRVDGRWCSLREWIAADPVATLGPDVAARHGELPFLLKLLAAEAPLSLQAHPDAACARAGFDREEAAGRALDAPDRNFPDPNPKPELLLALDRFEVLCGVRPLPEIRATLATLGGGLAAHFERALAGADLKGILRAWLATPPEAAARLAEGATASAHDLEAGDPGLAWLPRLARAHPGDVGVLAPIFLAYRMLEPGEGLFVGAGVMHGYLRGTALELQASSDNVLRGGLTRKHVDLDLLLSTLRPEVGPTPHPRGAREWRVATDRFALRVERPARGEAIACSGERGAEILFCTAGRAEIRAGSQCIPLGPGESAFVSGAAPRFEIRGDATLFRASAA